MWLQFSELLLLDDSVPALPKAECSVLHISNVGAVASMTALKISDFFGPSCRAFRFCLSVGVYLTLLVVRVPVAVSLQKNTPGCVRVDLHRNPTVRSDVSQLAGVGTLLPPPLQRLPCISL